MSFLSWFAGSTPAAIAGETATQTVGGLFKGITDIISEFHLSPEEELKLKIAIEQQRLEFYKAQTTDVQNARQMQVQTRSIWPGLLSTLMLVGFFAGGSYVLLYGAPEKLDADGRMILTLFVQTLISGVTLVLGYWLGSSSGSQMKDTMLLRAQPGQGQ
jgi:hypothetical protein